MSTALGVYSPYLFMLDKLRLFMTVSSVVINISFLGELPVELSGSFLAFICVVVQMCIAVVQPDHLEWIPAQ